MNPLVNVPGLPSSEPALGTHFTTPASYIPTAAIQQLVAAGQATPLPAASGFLGISTGWWIGGLVLAGGLWYLASERSGS